jgi:hypothetical protein
MMRIVMNSHPAGTGGAARIEPGARAPSSSRAYKRIAMAIGLSLLIHVLFVSEALQGLAGMFPWLTKGEPPAQTVSARIVTPPPPPPAPPRVAPEPPPPRPAATPPAASRPVARPRPAPTAPPVLASPTPEAAPVASSDGAPGGTAAQGTPAPSAAAPGPAAAPAATPAPPAPAPASFPTRARIDFLITRDSDNLTAYGVQNWHLENGRYRVRLDARLMFFSVAFESSGSQAGSLLRPERYVDDRRGKVTTVDFPGDGKNADVSEANGNRKSISLSGPATDLMSLPYTLALNPDMAVGTVLMLANRDSVDPARLMERRDEVLQTERGPVNTRYYSFKYVEGAGTAQVWLALEKQWLPAKLRIAGRDGPITFTATGYKVD